MRRCRASASRALSATLFAIAVASTALSAQAQESRLALVIGNQSYAQSPLINTLNDADDMAAALRQLGFTVMLRKDASRRAMKEAVQAFGQRLKAQGGVGLFYYSGHGYQQDGVNYLVPLEADVKGEADVEFELFSAERVLAEMEAAGNGTNLVIFDACRVDPLGKSWRKSGTGGLSTMQGPVGSLIAFATSPNEVASAGSVGGRNSVFTKHLLAAVRRDPNRSISDLFVDVTAGVGAETGGRQVPWQHSSLSRQFCFGMCQQPPGSDSGAQIRPQVPPAIGGLEQPSSGSPGAGRGWLGVQLQDMDQSLARAFGLERASGVVISEVLDNSPAQRIGLREGDVVLALNEQKITGVSDMRNQVGLAGAGAVVKLTVFRDGRAFPLQATLDQLPANMQSEPMSPDADQATERRAWLGVSIQNLDAALAQAHGLSGIRGVLVSEAYENSPAKRAGLRAGDVILECNGQEVMDMPGLRNLVQAFGAGATVQLTVWRARGSLTIPVTLEMAPASLIADAQTGGGQESGTPEDLEGVEVKDLTVKERRALGVPDDVFGVVVAAVDEESNAWRANLRSGQVIMEVSNRPVGSVQEFREAVGADKSASDRRSQLMSDPFFRRFFEAQDGSSARSPVLLRVWQRGAAGQGGGRLFIAVPR